MCRLLLAIVVVLGVLCPTLHAGELIPVAARLQLEGLRLQSGPTRDSDARTRKGEIPSAPTLDLVVEGRHYEIALAPVDRLLGGLPVAERLRTSATSLYRGTVAGMPKAWARVTVTGERIHVLLFDGTQWIAVEPGDAVSSPIAYRPDAYPALAMGADQVAHAHATTPKVNLTALAKADVNARLQIAWVTDSAFESRFGASAESELLARVNVVTGIFEDELGLDLEAVELLRLTSIDDPFDTDEPSALLDQVENLKLSSVARRAAGVMHLFSSRSLEGNTVGIATVGSACSARFGVSLTEARRPAAVDALIAAHEIGHNLNAPHDGEAGRACADAPAGFLMASRLNQSNEFSDCSIAVMVDFLSRATCLLPAGPNDVSLRGEVPATALLGSSTALQFIVDSPSGGTTANSTLTVAYDPRGLAVRGVSLAGGSCTLGDGRVHCVLGELPEGASSVLRLTLAGTSLGTWPLSVELAAADDPNPADNRLDGAITVRPAADLAVSFERDEWFAAPGGARRLPFAVRNDGPLLAQDVALTVDATQAQVLAVEELNACAPSPEGWRCELGALAVGDTRRGTLVARASDVPVPESGGRREDISARAISAFEDPLPGDNDAVVSLLVVDAVADLAARVLEGDGEIDLDTDQAFEFEVRNFGPDAAQAVALDIDVSLAVVSLIDVTLPGEGACTIDGSTVTCRLDRLAVGETRTVRVVLRALAGERLRLNTLVSSADYDPSGDNDAMSSEVLLADATLLAPAATSPTGGSSGGGGALSPVTWFWLLAMALVRARRRL
ncbi:MAG: M12 family metallo-peptidase [Pseudomonadota bacterium]